MDEELASTSMILSLIASEYNPVLCMICQKNKGVTASSTLNGGRKVIDAANIWKGNILNRLTVSECSSFV